MISKNKLVYLFSRLKRTVFLPHNLCKNEQNYETRIKTFSNKNLKTMTKQDCTRKIEQFRFYKTDEEICKKIGISRNTLYKRLKDCNSWKISEIYVVEGWKL